MKTKYEKLSIVIAGLLIGTIAALLVIAGNPANMGFCVACFIRDTAGALGLHRAAAVQYIRPELIGLILGACILALVKGEYAPRGGSSPMTRFVLGFFVMIGCLMFLGCPFRMILRLAGGDWNALFGLIGFVLGILAGVFFLNRGYSLKRTYRLSKLEGAVLPIIQMILLVLLIAAPSFLFFTEAGGGPGGKHAAIAISLTAGLLVGAMAQRTRLCMVGGIRDVVLFGEWKLLCGFVAILASAPKTFIPALPGSPSPIRTVSGTFLECCWWGLAVFCWAGARCGSLFLLGRATQILQSQCWGLRQALLSPIIFLWPPQRRGPHFMER